MDFEQSLGRYVGILNDLYNYKLANLLEEANTGITSDQFRLLSHLWKQDGINQQELSCIVKRDRASITRMIDILENQSIVTRIPDKDDRRVNLIYLTKKGKELECVAVQCAQNCLNEMTNNFTVEEKQQLSELLAMAIKNFKF